MINILVVEDEPAIADVVALFLQREGWHVRVSYDGQQALNAISEQLPSLVILDLKLPKVHGLELLRHLRQATDSFLPVIILTDRSQEKDRIKGLEMGADDYVSKPFSTAELVSRARAVLRRMPVQNPMMIAQYKRPLQFDPLVIDPNSRTVQVAQRTISLTATEFDLLYFLASHPRQIFTREQLFENVRGHHQQPTYNTISVHMRRLRQKVEPDPSKPIWVHTVWGSGYKFEAATVEQRQS